MASLVGGSLAVLLVRVSGAGLQLVLVGLAIVLFPIQEVGHNGVLWTTAIIARGVAPLGTDLYALREMPALWSMGDRPRFFAMCRGMSLELFKVLTLPTVILGVALTLVAYAGNMPLSMAWALPVAVVCSAMQRLWASQIRAQDRIILSQVFEGVLMPVLGILFMILSAFLLPASFVTGQAVAMFVGACLIWLVLVRGQDRSGRFRMSWTIWRSIVPLGVGSGLSILAARLPMLFIGAHSAVQAAHYDIGQRVHSATTLSSQAAAAVFLPRVRQLTLKGNIRQLVSELLTATALGVVPAGLVVAGLWLLGPDRLVALLGNEYAGTWEISLLMSVAAAVNAATGLCHGLLAMTGHSRAFMLIAGMQCLLIMGYAWFIFAGAALDMARFVLVAEILRSVVLVALATYVLRNLSAQSQATIASSLLDESTGPGLDSTPTEVAGSSSSNTRSDMEHADKAAAERTHPPDR